MAKKQDVPADAMAIGHHTGANIWGYDVRADGSIQLCPGFADQMRSYLDRHAALEQVQQSMMVYVASELERLAKVRRRWWDTLQDDLGIPIEKGSGWMFETRDGAVYPPKPSPQPEDGKKN